MRPAASPSIDRAAGPARCPWCGASTGDARPAGARRVTCAACGVGITWPWPEPAELDAAYAGHYRPATGRFSGPGDAVLRVTRGATARAIDRRAPPGLVVDVGAGDGHLVRALRRRGREAVGLERAATGPGREAVGLDRAAAGRGREAVGLDRAAIGRGRDHGAGGPALFDLGLEDVERPPDGAAAVVLWHVLEHLPAPRRTIAAAARLLRPGGLLVVACPNAASRQAAAFGDAWLAWDPPRHLVHLTPEALVAGVEAEGFAVHRLGHLRAGQSVFGALHGLVDRAPGTGDLYDAIRRPAARARPVPTGRRAWTLAAATGLLPVAASAATLEALDGRGGGIHLVAVRTSSRPSGPGATGPSHRTAPGVGGATSRGGAPAAVATPASPPRAAPNARGGGG